MKKTIIQIALLLVIVVLTIFLVRSIMEPVRYTNEKKFRYDLTIQKLKDIRSAEVAYRAVNKHYTGSFDTLINFIKHGEMAIVKMIPDPNDTTFSRSIMDTIGYVAIIDTIFGKRTDFIPDNLKYIPNSEGQVFTLEAGYTEKSKIMIPVFRASALNTQILYGMDEQTIYNEDTKLMVNDLFPGLFVGSMTEASTDGNWE
ncbi:hypothetical protein LJC25_05535 [Bacteroidales bacterium OttesenSCG-928-K03]|nr:hypothetical protein [Odoribacter sp. OttesenSCG-928-L07]MDL2243170.1 hypothetical protein [Bacteroidales bacterium OttesenSCG-928-K03]